MASANSTPFGAEDSPTLSPVGAVERRMHIAADHALGIVSFSNSILHTPTKMT